MLEVSLRHRLGTTRLDADFTAPPGLTVLFGRSGAGKTSIINAVAGLLRPNQGRIRLNDATLLDTEKGIALPPHKRHLGYIFQEARLFPHMTVAKNLTYGSADATPRSDILDMLDIGPLLGRRPAALSGGERQRVAIGRALLADPQLILADEPLASLDEARRQEILPYFERLRDAGTIPILYVSHSASEVARLATTVIALQDGRVTASGSAAEILGDPDLTAHGVREVGAVITGTVTRHHEDGLTEISAGDAPLFLPRITAAPGTALRLRIPAQDVILATTRPESLSALNILSGTVTAIRSGVGPGALVTLDTHAGAILSRITGRSLSALALKPGTACHAILKTVAIAPDNVSTH